MNTALIHINKKIGADMVRREEINGKDCIVISSATLPDDVVMNRGLYPASEIEKSYKGLERVLAPLGHPMIKGEFVTAKDPEAVNGYHVGAYVANVRRENGRVYHDTIIDVNVANSTEQGKRLIEAVSNMEKTGEPIHTSTGLYLTKTMLDEVMVNGAGDEYDWIASNIQPDHNAILINEVGAATPEQGVGLAVNSQGEQVEVLVHNEDDDSIDDKLELLRSMLRDAVKAVEPGANVWIPFGGVKDREVIYELETEDSMKLYKREYAIIDEQVSLGSERKEVKRKVVFKEVIANARSFIKNMLFANSNHGDYNDSVTNQTEGLEMTKEELQAELAPLQESIGKLQANQDALATLTSKVDALTQKLEANENQEREALVKQAETLGFNEDVIAGMETNALKTVVARMSTEGVATYAAGGQPVTNSSKSPLDGMEAP